MRQQTVYPLWILIILCASLTSIELRISSQDLDLSEKILFKSASPNTGFELFTIHPDGTNLTQLTHLNNLITDFQLSPDGKYIAFGTFAEGFSTNLILNIMSADGNDILQLTDNTTGGIFWSPDSKQIAFISKRNGLKELYIINIDGSNERRLTYGETNKFMNDVYSASWSPDGKQIAFIRLGELYMIDSGGGNEIILIPNNQQKSGVQWIDNGQKLTFAMTENNETSIYTIHPDGSQLTHVIDLPSQFTGFLWSPSEQYIIYTPKQSGVFLAFLANVDTKEVSQISEDTSGVSWSTDGKKIVYLEVSDIRQKTMRIIDIHGKELQSFTANNSYNDSSPIWIH